MRSRLGVVVLVAAVGVGTGCGLFGVPEATPEGAVPLEPGPQGAGVMAAPEPGPSVGMAAMAGLVGEVDGVPVLTTCDGIERVRVVPSEEAREQLTALSKQPGPTFALLRGERRRRTVDDVRIGSDGLLLDAVVLQGRPAADGDCGVPDLATHPVFTVPRDGEIAFSKVEQLSVHATWKLASELPERAGIGRTPQDAIEARLLEVTLGWCDGATSVRVDGYGVEWEVTSSADVFLGAWRVSCGRARNSVLRTGKTAGQPYALTLDGAPATFSVPQLGVDRPDRALAFGAWTLGLKPGCAGERCPEGLTPPPAGAAPARPVIDLTPPPEPPKAP